MSVVTARSFMTTWDGEFVMLWFSTADLKLFLLKMPAESLLV